MTRPACTAFARSNRTENKVRTARLERTPLSMLVRTGIG